MSLRGPTDETLPTVRRLIAEICAQYRSDWRRSDRCSIEDLVDPLAASERTAVLKALVALDVELREERGEHPKPAEYFKRFPIEASLISSAFPPQNSADETIESTFLWSGAEDDASFALGIAPELPAHTHALLDKARADGLPKAPAQLGRYEVLQYLGEGGYGRVYLARDHALGRDVAIKVPKSKTLSSPDRFEALLKEGRSTAALNHPSIVSVFDIGRSDDGVVFVVLEYVKGITLANLLKLERIKPVRLAECVAEVADAVHHAHQAGLVHRDLKPSNIIIDRHGKPRITYFGLALE
jgi:hypothetical protein